MEEIQQISEGKMINLKSKIEMILEDSFKNLLIVIDQKWKEDITQAILKAIRDKLFEYDIKNGEYPEHEYEGFAIKLFLDGESDDYFLEAEEYSDRVKKAKKMEDKLK